MMTKLQFHQFQCLSDNYGVLVHDPESGETASIDAPEASAVKEALEQTGWTLSHILVTHHHYDHTDGIAELKAKHDCQIFGPKAEETKIPGLEKTLEDGDTFEFGGESVEVISTPGHTLGMINYHFAKARTVFTGDTLFALGCGRIFEGDADMMWNSLAKLRQLPEDTTIYCGHEYTQANANFALTVDPQNTALKKRAEEISNLRKKGKPTLPTTLALELETNPFLRPDNKQIRAHLSMENASDAEVFAEIRKRKDSA